MFRNLTLLVFFGSLNAALFAAPTPRFDDPNSVWHQRIDQAPLHPQSANMLATLDALGGWGIGRMQIDFSLHVARDNGSAPWLPIVAHVPSSGGYYSPDCDALPATMPVPADAAFEGQANQSCNNGSADCHLLVVSGPKLYELYAGNRIGDELNGRCLAVWDTRANYPATGRGDHCTSADAAGFPIAPLLVNADGVAAALQQADGDLGHAIRFILPNDHMASDVALGGVNGRLYVRPASHAGAPSGPSGSVPYGVRMRLRSDFDVASYGAAQQVILRTMQRYGLVLADGGNIALTFESDRHTTTKWVDLDIGPHEFWDHPNPVAVTDFEIIDTGPRIAETYQCVRNTIELADVIFADAFE